MNDDFNLKQETDQWTRFIDNLMLYTFIVAALAFSGFKVLSHFWNQ